MALREKIGPPSANRPCSLHLGRRIMKLAAPMNIGFFGGRFDPIHRGHLALAQAAMTQRKLDRIYLVTAGSPPHKPGLLLSAFADRHAMVALATAQEKSLIASTLEAPQDIAQSATAARGKTSLKQFDYTIDSVRRLKALLKKNDRVSLLLGMDAFADIASWHEPEALFEEYEFIVASRPGHSLGDIAEALPARLRPKAAITAPFKKHAASGELRLRGVTIHFLADVHQNISATAVREAARSGKPLGKLVPAEVADYIRKTGLYRAR
jgi:nicotinate-nucleotide adenylyltransferase